MIVERVKYGQQASEESGSQHRKICHPSFQTNSFSYFEYIFTSSTLLWNSLFEFIDFTRFTYFWIFKRLQTLYQHISLKRQKHLYQSQFNDLGCKRLFSQKQYIFFGQHFQLSRRNPWLLIQHHLTSNSCHNPNSNKI